MIVYENQLDMIWARTNVEGVLVLFKLGGVHGGVDGAGGVFYTNAEKDYFDQQTKCEGLVWWSKYTTPIKGYFYTLA